MLVCSSGTRAICVRFKALTSLVTVGGLFKMLPIGLAYNVFTMLHTVLIYFFEDLKTKLMVKVYLYNKIIVFCAYIISTGISCNTSIMITDIIEPPTE